MKKACFLGRKADRTAFQLINKLFLTTIIPLYDKVGRQNSCECVYVIPDFITKSSTNRYPRFKRGLELLSGVDGFSVENDIIVLGERSTVARIKVNATHEKATYLLKELGGNPDLIGIYCIREMFKQKKNLTSGGKK